MMYTYILMKLFTKGRALNFHYIWYFIIFTKYNLIRESGEIHLHTRENYVDRLWWKTCFPKCVFFFPAPLLCRLMGGGLFETKFINNLYFNTKAAKFHPSFQKKSADSCRSYKRVAKYMLQNFTLMANRHLSMLFTKYRTVIN